MPKRKEIISLERTTVKDVGQYLDIEKSVAETKVYSGITDEEEARKEFKTNRIFFIKKKGKRVGTIQYEIKSPDHVYLSGLVINPRFQGQGIGRSAIKRILKKLRNIKRVDLVTHPHNTRALMLYLSLGFVIESWKENYYGDGEPRLVLSREK